MRVSCEIVKDMLRGDDRTAFRVKLVELVRDEFFAADD